MTNMTFKSIAGATAASLVLAGAVACSNDSLPTVNANPNAPTSAPAPAVFTNAVQNATNRFLGATYDLRNIELIVQHLAENQYISNDRYQGVTASALSATFTAAYSVDLQDFQVVVHGGATDPTVSAPAVIMQQWEFGYLTDTWGDVPYSQALAGDSSTAIFLPAYDAQKDIYQGFFTKLQKAATDLNGKTTSGLDKADPIYGGDNAKWQKFANSLHARYAMRIVNADPAKANAELTAAFTAPGGVFASNADMALLKWPGDGVFNSPWATNFVDRDDNRMSKVFVDTLNTFNDPRLPIFAQPAQATGKYAGQPNAISNNAAVAYSNNSSRPGTIFYPPVTAYGAFPTGKGNAQPSYLMTYAELLFLKAEAAERGLGGLTPPQAGTFYLAGITASMEQWGVPAAAIAAYLGQPAVAYQGGVAGQKQIAYQKWVALYTDGGNAWAEWRRTCVPTTVVPGPTAVLKYVPRRVLYPTAEVQVNNANVQAAIARQGLDKNDTRVYWDKAGVAPTCF